MKYYLLGLLLTVAFATSASAQKQTMLRGAGANSCGEYVQAYDRYRPFAGDNNAIANAAFQELELDEAWIQGYVFGVDTMSKGQLANFDRAGMQLWIYGYCQAHPLDNLAGAARAFVVQLEGPAPKGGGK